MGGVVGLATMTGWRGPCVLIGGSCMGVVV